MKTPPVYNIEISYEFLSYFFYSCYNINNTRLPILFRYEFTGIGFLELKEIKTNKLKNFIFLGFFGAPE